MSARSGGLFIDLRRAHPRPGLVDDVDRLVRLHSAGDVPVRQLDRRLQGVVRDLDAVVVGVALAEPLEDLERLGGARGLDRDRLEAALEGGVLLDVLAVLVVGRRADALDLAAGEGGLEHVGRVDRALGPAGADERVELVDEEDHVLGPADLVHDRLDPLLELAAVLRAGDHHGEVEHHEPLVVQQVGDVLAHDPLGEPLDDGGLADARLAEQHGVVLRAAAEHLDEPLDLVGPPDHRVELVGAGELGEIAAEAVEGGGLALAAPGGGAGLAGADLRTLGRLLALDAGPEQVEDLLADLVELEAEVHEHLGGHAVVLAEQPEQQVLGAHVVVIEVPGLLDGVLDHLLRAGCLRELAHRDHLGPRLHELLHLEPHLAQVDVEVLEDVRPDARAFLDQAEENVLRPDVLVVEALSLLVGQRHHLAGPIGQPFEHR
jgi:hypothetical protein